MYIHKTDIISHSFQLSKIQNYNIIKEQKETLFFFKLLFVIIPFHYYWLCCAVLQILNMKGDCKLKRNSVFRRQNVERLDQCLGAKKKHCKNTRIGGSSISKINRIFSIFWLVFPSLERVLSKNPKTTFLIKFSFFHTFLSLFFIIIECDVFILFYPYFW